MKNKVLKVGFDLDGVLLYNPSRIVRPIIYFLKKYVLKRNVDKFYYPKNKIEQLIWLFLHKTSLFPQPGIDEIKELIKNKKIKAYVISARYEFLKKDFYYWQKKIDPDNLFSGWFFNEKNQQPYEFKAEMIKKLNLDIFVEDNWDVVRKLKIKNQKLKIFWIYNLLDKNIKYKYKFPTLKLIIDLLKEKLGEKNKKILIVSDYFYPHWTGISKSIYNLIQINSKKLTFDILTTKHKKNLKSEEKIFKTTVYRQPYLFSISRLKYSPTTIFKFLSWIKNYNGVLVNSPYSNILFISLITKIFKKRLYIFHQGDLILPKGIKNKAIEKIFDFFSLISFRMADKVSTYTLDYAKNSRIIKNFLDKFSPIILPIIVKKSKISKNSKLYKKLRFLKKRKKILFGFGGRFVEEKGFDILLKAIPYIIKFLPNAHFVFVGSTNIFYENFFQRNLEQIKKTKKYITFLGLLNENSLNYFYKMIDFIVVPSRSDCFNLLQAEAMLSGTPSIASDIPGLKFLIKKTGFGILFKKEDSKDLANKIIIACKEKNKILKNKDRVKKILDIKINEKNIEEFFIE